jgi:hypothetical protein
MRAAISEDDMAAFWDRPRGRRSSTPNGPDRTSACRNSHLGHVREKLADFPFASVATDGPNVRRLPLVRYLILSFIVPIPSAGSSKLLELYTERA